MRLAIVIFAAAVLGFGGVPAADAEAGAWDVVATMAAALAEPNEYGFMKPISKSVETHDLIERQVRALVQTNDIVSTISPVTNEGDDKKRTVEVDWYMEIKPHAPGQSLVQRRETIRMVMEKPGKRWMITSIAPISFFSPPDTN
jgi:hypothetical protein